MSKLSDKLIDPVDNIFYSICEKIAPIFYKFKISPNMITTISLFFKCLTVYYFYYNNFVNFSIFYFIQYLFDCLDGTVARKYKQYSKYGELYDHTCDSVYMAALVYLTYDKYKFRNEYNMYYAVVLLLTIYRFSCVSKLVKNKNQDGIPYEKLCQHNEYKIIDKLKMFGEGVGILVIYYYICQTSNKLTL